MRLRPNKALAFGAALLLSSGAAAVNITVTPQSAEHLLLHVTGESLRFPIVSDGLGINIESVSLYAMLKGSRVPVLFAPSGFRGNSGFPSLNIPSTINEGQGGASILIFQPSTLADNLTRQAGDNKAPHIWLTMTYSVGLSGFTTTRSQLAPRQGANSVDSREFGITNLDANSNEFKEMAKDFQSNGVGGTGPNPSESASPTGDVPSESGRPSDGSGGGTRSTSTVTKAPTATGDGMAAVGGGSSSDTGLSTGAIAGIAVGAAVGVLILASALAWLVLRRRRRNNNALAGGAGGRPGLGYAAHGHGGGRSAEIIAEKEATSGVAESPHSPYSDDGHQRDSSIMVAGAAGASAASAAGLVAAHQYHSGGGHGGHDRQLLPPPGGAPSAVDYAPYSDHPSPAIGAAGLAVSTPRSSAAFPAPGSNASAAGGSPPSVLAAPVAASITEDDQLTTASSSTAAAQAAAARAAAAAAMPRAGTGMSGRYAHLVEDGMTAAEIARMEEEERELDAAIAQARGVTTK